MLELDNIEGRVLKNWFFQIVMLEKTLEHLLESKEIKPVNIKGSKPWTFIRMSDAEARLYWPPDSNSWLIGKDPDAGKNCWQKEKVTEDETVGWHHQCNGHELGQTPGDGEGQGSLTCFSPWGREESDTTRQLKNSEPTWGLHLSVSHLFAFSYCSWGFQGKNTEVVAIPFSSGPSFVRTLHHGWLGRPYKTWLIVLLS